MTKIIHCIKCGPNTELGDFELSCINSWRKIYPDFDIVFWDNEKILPLISDCKYAVSCYKNGKYAFVVDYVKYRILYEHGGLYMDTDVFCVNRVPDSCFETAFTAWDAGFDTYWGQNGTCLYAEKGDKFIKAFMDMYKEFDEYPKVSYDNTVVETLVRKLGLNYYDRTTCQFTNQDVGGFRVYNCIQFGGYDYTQNLMWTTNKENPIYMVHARTKSWMNYLDENVYLYYAFINEDDDNARIYAAIDRFIKMKITNQKCKAVLVLGLNTVSGKANWFSKWLNLHLRGNDKSYLVAPLGNNMGEDELNAAFLDFVTKRFNKIKFCRDIMDGKFTGELNV